MVKQIIKEAMEKNPIGLKEAVEAELRTRVTLALEAKMKKEDEHEDDMDDDLDENFKSGDKVSFEDEYGQMVTGKYHRYLGKNKGHVKIAGGTDVNVHHSRLNNESNNLEESSLIAKADQLVKKGDADNMSQALQKVINSMYTLKPPKFRKQIYDLTMKELKSRNNR